MQAILSRLPDTEAVSRRAASWGEWAKGVPGRLEGYVSRNAVRIAGLAAGALGTLMLGLLFSVIYSGVGVFSEPAPAAVVVYPNF